MHACRSGAGWLPGIIRKLFQWPCDMVRREAGAGASSDAEDLPLKATPARNERVDGGGIDVPLAACCGYFCMLSDGFAGEAGRQER